MARGEHGWHMAGEEGRGRHRRVQGGELTGAGRMRAPTGHPTGALVHRVPEGHCPAYTQGASVVLATSFLTCLPGCHPPGIRTCLRNKDAGIHSGRKGM